MSNTLTPREIQARIRSGASVAEVAAEAEMDAERVEAFAGPVLAEREHMAASAQTATIRRRGEAGTHRRLGELIDNRLTSRGLDSGDLQWDAWRQGDLKWRVVARIGEEAEAREAEFVFDPKGRFSVAHNADARWMIGEEPPGAEPQDENTVDFTDELALVRATQEAPGDDVPASDLMHEANEDTSQLDKLYDMLSGISEDSVRIYTGLAEVSDSGAVVIAKEVTAPVEADEPESDGPESDEAHDDEAADEPTTRVDKELPVEAPAGADVVEPTQDVLVDEAEVEVEHTETQRPKSKRRRAKVPSWDEIMFGGPTK